MAIGLLGKKLGMTQIFDDQGRQIGVTVVQAGPCTVLRLREPERDGYAAIQVGFEAVKEARVSKPRLGQFKKAGTGPFRYVHEFRLPPAAGRAGPEQSQEAAKGKGEETEEQHAEPAEQAKGAEQQRRGGWAVGQEVTIDLFKKYEIVDVIGTSIGKGFQGGMKRWGWSGGPKSHGSMSHRRPGSIGASAFPARVFKGHHLPGHMGSARVTIQNLRIVDLDPQANLLFIEGAIPGAKRSLVVVQKSYKRFEVVKPPEAVAEVVEEEEKGKRGRAKKK